MSIFEEYNEIERLDEVTPREYQPDDFDAALVSLKKKGNIMEKELAASISMLTYTGKTFYPYAPKKDDICIEDIAHSLALQCRFGGHTTAFYSVAEHCLNVAALMQRDKYSDQDILAALLHEAAEAYFQDMLRCHQKAFPNRRVHELKLETIIYEWAGIKMTRELLQMIDTYKQLVVGNEMFKFFKNQPPPFRPIEIRLLSWFEAEDKYISCYFDLTGIPKGR